MPKSRDAFRTISEVSEWLETPAHVLRFWESKFTQVKPVKRAGGRRYYRPGDMELLGGIKKLLHEDGMTIKGVQKVLREQGVRYVSGLSAPVDPDEDVDIAATIEAEIEEAPFVEVESADNDSVVAFRRETEAAPLHDGDEVLPDLPEEDSIDAQSLFSDPPQQAAPAVASRPEPEAEAEAEADMAEASPLPEAAETDAPTDEDESVLAPLPPIEEDADPAAVAEASTPELPEVAIEDTPEPTGADEVTLEDAAPAGTAPDDEAEQVPLSADAEPHIIDAPFTETLDDDVPAGDVSASPEDKTATPPVEESTYTPDPNQIAFAFDDLPPVEPEQEDVVETFDDDSAAEGPADNIFAEDSIADIDAPIAPLPEMDMAEEDAPAVALNDETMETGEPVEEALPFEAEAEAEELHAEDLSVDDHLPLSDDPLTDSDDEPETLEEPEPETEAAEEPAEESFEEDHAATDVADDLAPEVEPEFEAELKPALAADSEALDAAVETTEDESATDDAATDDTATETATAPVTHGLSLPDFSRPEEDGPAEVAPGLLARAQGIKSLSDDQARAIAAILPTLRARAQNRSEERI